MRNLPISSVMSRLLCFIMTNERYCTRNKNKITITTKKGNNLALCAGDLKFCTLVPNASLNNLRSGSGSSRPSPLLLWGKESYLMVFRVLSEFLGLGKNIELKNV